MDSVNVIKKPDLILDPIVSSFKCIDSKSFSLDVSNETCDEIGLDDLSRNLLCIDDIIQQNCPFTCGMCCYDDSEFKLDTVTNDQKDCFWLFKKGPRQRKKYCSDEAVSESCPFTCGTCKSRFDELESGAISKSSKSQGKGKGGKKGKTSKGGGKSQGKAKGGTPDQPSKNQEKSKKPKNTNPTPSPESQGKGNVSKNSKTTKNKKGKVSKNTKNKKPNNPGPTPSPTYAPTYAPTHVPTPVPTYAPTHVPTHEPTPLPTPVPTPVPTRVPTRAPSADTVPSNSPSVSPNSPSVLLSAVPSAMPNVEPIGDPSAVPSALPSGSPSFLTSAPSFESIAHSVCQNYAVYARATITFASVVTTIQGGDAGVYPGTSITRNPSFIDGEVVSTPDTLDFAASVVLEHDSLMNLDSTAMAIEIGGLTFTPGVYHSGSAINFAFGTVVTLDGENQPNPTFIFQAMSTFVTAADTHFILINGAKAENVIWVLGTAATLGARSIVEGSILAKSAITFGANSVLHGCALAQTAVTFETAGSVDVM